MRRVLVHIGAAIAVVLLARSIGYALEPTRSARILEQRAGGPTLPLLVLVTLTLGAAIAIAVCWLAALGVRERAQLERRPPPSFGVRRLLATAFALAVVTSVGGGLLEAYVHWRAGIGWHGLHCLFGPVHRDLLPIEGSLSLVAAALIAGGEHVLAWMRRTFALLRALPPRLPVALPELAWRALQAPALLRVGRVSARAPPALS